MANPVRGGVPEVEDGPEYDFDFRDHPERYRHPADERVERGTQQRDDEEKREIDLVYKRYLGWVRADDAYERAIGGSNGC